MKKTLFTFFALAMVSFMTMAQNSRFEFHISQGLSNTALKATIERQVTNLLDMMDYSQRHNLNSLNFRGISISDDAKNAILKMWKAKHLCVWQDEEGETNYIESMCLKFGKTGYQVRNIPMRVFPVTGTIKDPYTEVCINFDLYGKIVDFTVTMKNLQIDGIAKGSDPVKTERERMMIERYMIELQQAYNDRDLPFFERIFSEDALIITGVKKYKTVKSDVRVVNRAEYEYIVKTKREYLASLKQVFQRNRKDGDLNVIFSNLKVTKARNGDYYMVYATQDWEAKNYCDLGKVTILWDFTNPDEPQILVRVWQGLDDLKKYGFNDFPLK